jgi:hypothetical protein
VLDPLPAPRLPVPLLLPVSVPVRPVSVPLVPVSVPVRPVSVPLVPVSVPVSVLISVLLPVPVELLPAVSARPVSASLIVPEPPTVPDPVARPVPAPLLLLAERLSRLVPPRALSSVSGVELLHPARAAPSAAPNIAILICFRMS